MGAGQVGDPLFQGRNALVDGVSPIVARDQQHQVRPRFGEIRLRQRFLHPYQGLPDKIVDWPTPLVQSATQAP